MKATTSTPLFQSKKIVATALVCIFLMLSLGFLPISAAPSFPASPSVNIGAAYSHVTRQLGTCWNSADYFAFFEDTSTLAVTYWTSSSGGSGSWSGPSATLLIATNGGTRVYAACNANGSQILIEWSDSTLGVNKYTIDYELCTISGAVVSPCSASATVKSAVGGSNPLELITNGAATCPAIIGGSWYLATGSVNGLTNKVSSIANGANTANATVSSSGNYTGCAVNNTNLAGSGTFAIMGTSGTNTGAITFIYSSDFTNWKTEVSVNAPGGSIVNAFGSTDDSVSTGTSILVFYENNDVAAPCVTNCMEMVTITAAGVGTASRLFNAFDGTAGTPFYASTDGAGNIVLVHVGANQNSVVGWSNNNGVTWSYQSWYQFAGYTGSSGGGMSEITTGNEVAVISGVDASTQETPYSLFFGVNVAASTVGQGVTLGSCPTKNTATTSLTNNTEYIWTANTFSQETLNVLTAEVASVNSGHSASETMYFMFYVTPGVGGVSVANPLVLGGFKTFTMSATSSPQSIMWSLNLLLPNNPGSTVAIALLGNSKILINQSSLSGMFTASGNAGVPVLTITSLTSTGNQLFFCATASYQNVVTTTSTSTTTSIVTTGGGTATVTTTTTATSIDAATAATTSIGAALLIIIILLPAVLLTFALGVTTKSPSAAGMGFVAGLTIGTAIGNRAGLVPFYMVAIMVVVMIFIIIGLLLFSRAQG